MKWKKKTKDRKWDLMNLAISVNKTKTNLMTKHYFIEICHEYIHT